MLGILDVPKSPLQQARDDGNSMVVKLGRKIQMGDRLKTAGTHA